MKKIILALMMFASLQAGAQTQSTTTTQTHVQSKHFDPTLYE